MEERREERRADTGHRLHSNIQHTPQSTGGGEEEDDSGGLTSGHNIKQKQNYSLRNNEDLLNDILLVMTLGCLKMNLR